MADGYGDRKGGKVMEKDTKDTKISTRSPKNEILDAYNELLKKMQEQKPVDRQVEKKKEEEKKIVSSASQLSTEKIIKGLADLKLEIGKSFEFLEEQLITQYKKLTDLQTAINVEQQNLEEIHEIKVNADSLAALLQAQAERKVKFETEVEQEKKEFDTEIVEKKDLWKKEQEAAELAKKERDERLKKDRQREEEEYTYTLQLKRKKDKDEYEAKKQALEKELVEKKAAAEKDSATREAAVAAREAEYEKLKTQVEVFPQQLEKAVKDAEKAISERLTLTYKHEATLAAKDREGEKKLLQQTIGSLESKIKEQEALMRELTQRSNEAGKQVQHIAIKAIEGASAQRGLAVSYEKKGPEKEASNQ